MYTSHAAEAREWSGADAITVAEGKMRAVVQGGSEWLIRSREGGWPSVCIS